jgi:CRISPR-associated protein Cas2
MALYIISYDIKNDKARLKLFKLLKDYGTHVQYSVFEATLKQKQFDKMLSEIGKIKIDKKCDSIIIYSLNKICVKNKIKIGRFIEDPEKNCFVV